MQGTTASKNDGRAEAILYCWQGKYVAQSARNWQAQRATGALKQRQYDDPQTAHTTKGAHVHEARRQRGGNITNKCSTSSTHLANKGQKRKSDFQDDPQTAHVTTTARQWGEATKKQKY